MESSRHQKILDYLAGRENISVKELSRVMAVTEVTIRSDLTSLARLGKISRTHGGARLVEERLRQEYTFQTRKSLNAPAKHRIGKAAAALVGPLDSVLLDSSTTALAMAHELRQRTELRDLTVIPTGVWTAIELMGSERINVLLPSGYLRQVSGSITGLPAEEFFGGLNIQKAFLGAWGISPERGLTDSHLLEVDLKKRIVAKAGEIIILADGSKFYQTGLASFAALDQVHQIITDETAPPDVLKLIEGRGVKVTIVR